LDKKDHGVFSRYTCKVAFMAAFRFLIQWMDDLLQFLHDTASAVTFGEAPFIAASPADFILSCVLPTTSSGSKLSFALTWLASMHGTIFLLPLALLLSELSLQLFAFKIFAELLALGFAFLLFHIDESFLPSVGRLLLYSISYFSDVSKIHHTCAPMPTACLAAGQRI
jgi:hypothetical protein